MALNAPPENLHTRRLPFTTVPGEIYRISRRKYADPLHWSKKGANRFDAPLHLYGVLYTAANPECALLEVFGDIWAQDRVIPCRELDDFELCTLTVSHPLSVADFTGNNLNRLGTDANLFASLDYELTRQWADALMNHPECPQGILYHSRKNPLLYSYALFGTPLTKSAIGVSRRLPLRRYPYLMRDLLKYDVALL
jgi:hypothetical protein